MEIDHFLRSPITTMGPRNDIKKKTQAFAFDVDGVLHRGGELLPHAACTLRMLQEKMIPFIILTNGGGNTEEEFAKSLSGKLQVDIHPAQVVLAHTPFRQLAPSFSGQTVLAIGGIPSRVREVARAYGFGSVVTPSDIFKADPTVHPFAEFTRSSHEREAVPVDLKSLKVGGIFVFSSPRDWYFELQLIVDFLLSSQGRFGTASDLNGRADLPNNGYLMDGQPALFFCNGDLTFPNKFSQSRLAQGSFIGALRGVWKTLTGCEGLGESFICGKPEVDHFRFAHETLEEWNRSLVAEAATRGIHLPGKVGRVTMIGDNPASDIRGANMLAEVDGADWQSILVETGCYEAGTEPAFRPTYIVPNVKSAVDLVLSMDEE